MTDDERVDNSAETINRNRPNFAARTAEGDDSRLAPEGLADQALNANEQPSISSTRPYEPLHSSEPSHGRRPLPFNVFENQPSRWSDRNGDGKGSNGSEGRLPRQASLPAGPLAALNSDKMGNNKNGHNESQPAGDSDKLGTFSGVFVPTTLNVLSILMFLRFGFILGQGGVLGMMGMSFVLLHFTHLRNHIANSDIKCRPSSCFLHD